MSALRGFGDVAVAARELVARRFASAAGRLHHLGGGDPATRAAVESCAARCWRSAQEHGHSCIALGPDELAALAASPAVAPAAGAMAAAGSAQRRDAALVLEADHLFLERLWRAEWQLARRLLELAAPAPLAPAADVAAMVATVFGGADPDDAQQRAVTVALSRRLSVISGGPGTGKTTTLARLIAAYSRLKPEARIALAAPTGKAAARVSEALHAQLLELAAADRPASAVLPGAMTLHRLLGIRGTGSRPAFGATRPLPFDLIVVDEASMVDLELASALVAAMGGNARLVLAGDRDQLASVEAGAVFAALCAARDPRLSGGVVTLERNYRQRETPEIVAWAQAARTGTIADIGSGQGGVRLQRLAGAGGGEQATLARSVLAGYAPALELLADAGAGAEVAPELLRRLSGYRVLCALRRGPLGVAALNRVVAAAARAAVGADPDATWYPGRFVIVSRNTRELGLFNGDTGVCLRRDGALAVAFPLADRLHWVGVAQMPACADAFALTVHQSQGSEFDQVALVAAPAGHRLATRELIYTGITRARLGLEIFAAEGALAAAAARVTERTGLLGWRLAEGAR